MTLWVQVIVGQDESSPQGEKGTPEGWTYIPWGVVSISHAPTGFLSPGVCFHLHFNARVCVFV